MSNLEKTYLSGLFYHKPELLDVLVNYLKYDDLNLPILSIGSGNGYVEYYIKETLINNDIICIDPAPESFKTYHPTKHIKPTHNYLSDADCTNFKNSIVLLNWPNPDNDGYDINSISELIPRFFCVVYGPCGASGSENLINKLSKCYMEPSFSGFKMPSDSTEMLFISNIKYDLIYSYTLTIGSGYGFTGRTLRLVIYVRHDYLEKITCQTPVILSQQISNVDGGCVIS